MDGSRNFGASSPQPAVLIVETDVIVRTAVAAYLRECGYRVLETGSSDDAKRVLESDTAIEVLFTVVELPDEQAGFALANWARRNKPDIKVILTSGVARAAVQAGNLCQHGPMLAKPYDHVSLERHIRRLLAKSPAERG